MTTLLVPDGDTGALADRADAAPAVVLDGPAPDAHVALDEILPTPAGPRPAAPAVAGIRTARVTGLTGRRAKITFRGHPAPVDATVAPEVDPAVVADAVDNGDSVLVEVAPGEAPLVVGVLHTRRPRAIRLKASTIEIEGDEEVVVRSGRGALRIRADGDVEVVGSRISAASRGLFRIVGRILRLN
jgi:hypothetical protein